MMIRINNKFIIVSILSIGLLFGSASAFAESSPHIHSNQFGAENLAYDMLVVEIMDMDVVNNADQNLGKIDNLTLNNDGKIEYAILSVGGFLGIGDKLAAVPFKDLRVNKHEEKIILDVNQKQLEQAAEFIVPVMK